MTIDPAKVGRARFDCGNEQVYSSAADCGISLRVWLIGQALASRSVIEAFDAADAIIARLVAEDMQRRPHQYAPDLTGDAAEAIVREMHAARPTDIPF